MIKLIIAAYAIAALIHMTRKHGLTLSDFGDALAWPGTKAYRFFRKRVQNRL